MGLDMHLYRQQYASPEFEETVTLEQEREPVSIKPVRPTYLREEIGYRNVLNLRRGVYISHPLTVA